MPQITNLADAERAIAAFPKSRLGPDGTYTLVTMQRFMEYLGNPQNSVSVIHVAGTSGKTSTCYYIAGLLRQSGYGVGLSVSPHIDAISERAQINMAPLPEMGYCTALNEFLPLAAASDLPLTYFEILNAFSYWLFAKRRVDFAIIEVGLGGLLDPTNVITNPNKIAVIADIGIDHTRLLGNTLSAIAAQKAGIILPGGNAFVQSQTSEVMNAIQATANLENATLHIVESRRPNSTSALPLFQQRNLSLATEVVNYALERNRQPKLSQTIIATIAHKQVPARMEIIHFEGATIILDGSHNPQKIQALVASVAARFKDQPIDLLVGKRSNLADSLEILRTISDSIVITTLSKQDEQQTIAELKGLKQYCVELGFRKVNTFQDPSSAFQYTLVPGRILLVTGSFFLLRRIRELI